MEALIKDQESIYRYIVRTVDNVKKIGESKLSDAVVENRKRILEDYWQRVQDTHQKIVSSATEEQSKTLEYFVTKRIETYEDGYLNASDYLADLSRQFNPIPVNPISLRVDRNCRENVQAQGARLPKINLPTFNGEYVNWESFRDMFVSLVDSNASLTAIEKFHYLKTSLTGEAALMIKSIPPTTANYTRAWERVKKQFDNTRLIVTALIRQLLTLEPLKNDDVKGLKRLRDKFNEHVDGLESHNFDMNHLGTFLVVVFSMKLDPVTLKAWDLSLGNKRDLPTYQEFDTFLEGRVNALESFASSKVEVKSGSITAKPKFKQPFGRTHVTTTVPSCMLCKSSHKLDQCHAFVAKTPEQRRDFARGCKLCFNCLKPGHFPRQCSLRQTCSKCQQKHHVLLHSTLVNANAESFEPRNRSSGEFSGITAPTTNAVAQISNVHFASETNSAPKAILLATACIKLFGPNGHEMLVRALIDPCSQSTFISEAVAQSLSLPRFKTSITFTGINDIQSSNVRFRTDVCIGPRDGTGPKISASVFILKTVSKYLPPQTIDAAFLRSIPTEFLADSDPAGQQPIHVLLGADIYASMLLDGLRRDRQTGLIAQNTLLGWIILGSAASRDDLHAPSSAVHHTAIDDDLNASIKRFWEVEELPASDLLTDDERKCEEYFQSSTIRRADGTFQVRLPFKSDPPIPIGGTYQIAFSMLQRLERRLDRDAVTKRLYHAFMRQYLEMGHMTLATSETTPGNERIFLPHHPVIKPQSTTTKLRVVFNAACRSSNGTALNDHLLIGPKLQTDIIRAISMWRQSRFVLAADIEKMYRQIWVDPRDVDFQCILWRFSADEPVQTYQLQTVTYGTSCAPFLALRVVKQLATTAESQHPSAAKILRDQSYVDDILFGSDTVTTALANREQLCALLISAGFRLRKWLANDGRLLEGIPLEDRECATETNLQDDDHAKVLGLTWNPRTDTFSSCIAPLESIGHTKRAVLSVIAQYFDPLGWAAAVIIKAKILMQDLWLAKLDWDEDLPNEYQLRWAEYCHRLPELNNICMPRWTGYSDTINNTEIHGFADASSRAYAACVYLRIVGGNGCVKISLLLAKTKVAPVKTVSVPRLELCAAVLLTRAILNAQQAIGLSTAPMFCWTDSSIVLCWLQRHASTWSTFVANRVAFIQSSLPNVEWRHVSSADNPADCATRGLSPHELQDHSIWWSGPSWLSKPRENWPKQISSPINNRDLEAKGNGIVLVGVTEAEEWDIIQKISRWLKLLRVIAYCMRYVDIFRKVSPPTQVTVSAVELQKAETVLLRIAQKSSFSQEIEALQQGNQTHKSSRVYRLNPFVDDQGLLRVGGRLQRSALPYGGRHPVILTDHSIARKIVVHTHEVTLHGGAQLMLSTLRQKYWILGARNLVKRVIRECITCVRIRASLGVQLMGTLPSARVSPSRPFTHTGVDYAGPIMVRSSKGRGHQAHKAYVALFICLATRAIHLELVSDYSSEAFVAAFHRFVSRRGLPESMYSDNGTTFTGANRELQIARNHALDDSDLLSFSAARGIRWHFSPPQAPHFGGLWEAGVKSVKHHLRRVIGDTTLTFEEFYTLLTRIEACLNSRPMGPLNDDPHSLDVLTPGHFLIGTSLIAAPEPSLIDLKENRLSRWQLIQQRVQRFWRLWSADYLHTLQQRYKWAEATPNLEVGDIVLIKAPNVPPTRWVLGRVLECFPGPDGCVRVVKLKTQTATLTRSIAQLCYLPIRRSTIPCEN